MEWNTKRFGDVCAFVRGPFGGSLKKNIFKEEGFAVYEQQHAIYDQFENIRYFIDQEKFSEMSRFELFPGDLIMSCSGTMGKIAIVPDGIPRGIINQALLKLTPNKELSSKFLKLWMESQNFQEEIESLSQGAAIQNMASVKILKEIKVPVPTLEEQKRIVAILDQAFADIDQARATAETNLKNARELFDSYLQQVFSQGGECRATSNLEDLVSSDCSLSYGIVQPGEEYPTGLPVVRPTDLTSKIIHLNGLKLIDPKLADSYKRTTLQGGELLLCVRGATGVISIASDELKGANVTRGIVPVRFKPDKLIQKYGYYQFISRNIQKQISEKTYGAALMQINIRDVKKLKFSLPPIEEQKEVILTLDEITKLVELLENVYQNKVEKFEELKKSILQKAFTGELTKSKGIAA